jgi:hypothetical protein
VAVQNAIETDAGIPIAAAYWRLSSFDQLPNRQATGGFYVIEQRPTATMGDDGEPVMEAVQVPVAAVARFRAYASGAAFLSGKVFVAERLVEFTPTGIGANLAAEAYAALKALPEFEDATDV